MRIDRSRVFMGALFLGFFVTTAAVILTDDVASSQAEERVETGTEGMAHSSGQANAQPDAHSNAIAQSEPKPEVVSPISNDPDACVAGAPALEDIKVQREKLKAREKELTARESELKALEKAVKEEFAKLEQVRAQFAKADELKKKENEEKVAKIVETLETMGPKPASALMASIDEALAITAMQRMSTPKLAKIMNVMEAGRSSRLTELLAGVVRARSPELVSSSRIPASRGAAATTKTSTKGGER